MPSVDAQNFDTALPTELRDEFWRRVKFSLRHFYNESEDLADDYRKAVEQRPVGEQLLLYHEDPLGIASDLADAADGGRQYADTYRKHFPDPFG